MKMILLGLIAALAFLGGAVGGDVLHGAKPAAAANPTASPTGHGADTAEADHSATTSDHDIAPAAEDHDTEKAADWFRFPNQFFVPILRNGTTIAVMVMSLTLEVSAEALPGIQAQEHRLRDALLNALMKQANTGAFDGNFTSEAHMEALRKEMLAAAQDAAGPEVIKVLIGDIARQEQ